MHKILMLPVLALVPAAASGQITQRIVTTTDLYAVAGPDSQRLPANTDVSRGARVSASYTKQIGGWPFTCRASAVTSVSVAGLKTTFHCDAMNGAYFCAGARAGGRVRMTLRSPTPTAGVLRLRGSSRQGWGAIDVGDDGRPELRDTANASADVAVVVGPAGLDVAVNLSSVTSLLFPAPFTVELVPGPTALRPYGSGCGRELTAWHVDVPGRHEVELRAQRLAATGDSFFVLGLRRRDLPIPPTGCRLLTGILAPIRVPVGAGGVANLRLPVPPGARGARFLAQFMQGRAGNVWHTSGGVQVDLP